MTPMATIASCATPEQTGECNQEVLTHDCGAIPSELTSDDQLPLPAGTVEQCGDRSYDQKPWLSALTSMFLHSGWLHLCGNMVYLFVFGQATEDRLGRLRYLLFYLICGYA